MTASPFTVTEKDTVKKKKQKHAFWLLCFLSFLIVLSSIQLSGLGEKYFAGCGTLRKREKPGQNSNMARRGEERGRKESSESLLLPNPYLNVTSSVRAFC